MTQNESKKACVLFRSIVEAADELNDQEALELYKTYARIGLGEEVDLNKCSLTVRLILKQNIESLTAAERRYQAAVENGKKGKESGKKGGRPRRGETKEEYKERKRRELESGMKDNYVAPKDEKREKAKNLVKNYRRSDAKYGRGECTLTPGWVKKNILSGQKCVYCGETDWRLLGCDRIDNSLPHTPENVVCSCANCNIKRGETPYEEFVEKMSPNSPVKPQNQMSPNSPVKPLEVEVEEDKEIDKEKDISKEIDILNNNIDKYKNLSWEDYLKLFINKHPEINYELELSLFTLTYKETLEKFQEFLYNKTGKDIPINCLTFEITYYACFGQVYNTNQGAYKINTNE